MGNHKVERKYYSGIDFGVLTFDQFDLCLCVDMSYLSPSSNLRIQTRTLEAPSHSVMDSVMDRGVSASGRLRSWNEFRRRR